MAGRYIVHTRSRHRRDGLYTTTLPTISGKVIAIRYFVKKRNRLIENSNQETDGCR